MVTSSNRLSAFLDATRKNLLNVVAIVATGFVVWVIAHQMFLGDYEVMTIEVPSSLAQKASGEVVSAAIRDGIAEDWRRAANSSAINVIQRDKEEPDVAIGGTNLPLRYVAKVLRREFRHPIVEITGQMIEVDPHPISVLLPVLTEGEATPSGRPVIPLSSPTVRLTLRNSEGPQVPFFDEEGKLDDVIQNAALASLEQIDPFAAVLAGSQGTPDQRLQALRVAKSTLKTLTEDGAIDAQVGKALLAEATAFFSLRRNDEAEIFLQRAIQALAHPIPDHKLLSVAQDGLAIVYIQSQQWPRARQAVEKSLKERNDYDSAKYHAVEIDDKVSRAYFSVGADGGGNACLAESSYWAAVKGYTSFFADNPRFSIAYTQYATMRLIRLHWLRAGNMLPDCLNLQKDTTLEADKKDTKDALEQATTEDRNNNQAWFQYANLLYELQDPQYVDSENNLTLRGFLLRDAEEGYRKALYLDSGDYYVWFRFAETLSQDVDLRPIHADDLRRQAIAAYCSSVTNNRRDLGLIEAAKVAVEKLHGTCP